MYKIPVGKSQERNVPLNVLRRGHLDIHQMVPGHAFLRSWPFKVSKARRERDQNKLAQKKTAPGQNVNRVFTGNQRLKKIILLGAFKIR